jgi:histone-arginine methyltransferase CARM1
LIKQNFYGVDVTPFADAAWEEAFSSPVVGCFGPLVLLSTSNNYNVDFLTISKEDLKRFVIPLSFDIAQTAVVHGLAGWFDLHFLPPPSAPFSAEDTLAMEEVITASTPELEMKMASTSNSNSSDATIDLGFGIGSSSNTSEALRTNTTSQVVDPTISSSYMTTSPYATPTHWQQVRFLFQEPLAINKGQRIVGEMLCEVNDYRWVFVCKEGEFGCLSLH